MCQYTLREFDNRCGWGVILQNPENLSCAGLKQFSGVSLFSEERDGSGGAHVHPPSWGKFSETVSDTGQSGVAWDRLSVCLG